MTASLTQDRIRVAVITGQHAFDVPGFHALLRSMPEIDFYPQDLANFAADVGQVRDWYDALVFYNYHQSIPANGDGPGVRKTLGELTQREQGIVLWHHGLVAFPRWSQWGELSGLTERTFTTHLGTEILVEVEDPDHPITQDLDSWCMVDETYALPELPQDSRILLTTQHPDSMKALAWTREIGRARVFCYQSGHDRQAYDDPSFRRVLVRGIRWAAGAL